MRGLKALAVAIVSLALVISAHGDVQAKKTGSKDDKQAQKQSKQDQKQIKQDDKEHKSGFKKVLRNPFKRQPKSQEADCRKFPNAPGCPDIKQAKQMEKQVSPSPQSPSQQKVAKKGKPVPKQAFRPTPKSAKKPIKKNAKSSKASVNKAHKTANPKMQAKDQIAQK
jgi:hypothetical protein